MEEEAKHGRQDHTGENGGGGDLRARRAAVLKPERRDVPSAGEGEILIRVRAAGVNRPDVQQRKGAYPPPPGASDLPGLEVAGEVAALGEGAKRWRVGDRVCALTPGGGYAEYVKVHGPTRCRCRPASPSPRRRRYPKPTSPSGTMSSSAAG